MNRVEIAKLNRIMIVYNRNSGKQLFASMIARVNQIFKGVRALSGCPRQVLIRDVYKFADLDNVAFEVVAQQTDWVIIAGGDGTIRALIEKILNLGYRPYFSIFPAGTVNLVARELQASKEPLKWLKRISKGVVGEIYTGRANGHLFLTVAGIGYDSLIVDSVSETSKKLLNKFAYVWQGAEMLRKELLRQNWRYHFRVRCDDEPEWQDASTLLVCKSRYYAGRYMLFEHASLCNPYFNVAVFTGCKSADFIRYSALLGLEALGLDKTVCRRQARKLEIECNVAEFPAELDGDVVTVAPLQIEIDDVPLQFIM